MARIRSIKPEFWTDETMAEISRDARLLFLGLLNHVDDEGRCVDNPRLVKAAVFPLDDDITPEIVRRLLDELSTKARLVLYEASQRRFLQVSNFRKHQKIDRPQPSRLPAPDDCNIVRVLSGQSVIAEPSTNDRRTIDEGSTPDRDQGSGIRDQGSKDSVNVAPKRKRASGDLTAAEAAEFDTFWSAYPRRVSKHAAQTKWRAAMAIAGSIEPILLGVSTLTETARRDGTEAKYLPHPATWLHQRRWEDAAPDAASAEPRASVDGPKVRIRDGVRETWVPNTGWCRDFTSNRELVDYES